MSYILEALKKAQAERQLGSTPGIHDAPVPVAVRSAAPANARLWLALGAAVLFVGGGFALMRMLVRPAPSAPPVIPVPSTALVATARPAAPVAVAAPAPVRAPQPAPQPAIEVAQTKPVAAAAAAPQAQPEDKAPTLASLPPSVASGIPRVTLGGYIYSPVPSERLLLVDKELRREGEEVAPGLILEKLMPDGAVLNYRGTRFRMPY